jgi:hypothetical protein
MANSKGVVRLKQDHKICSNRLIGNITSINFNTKGINAYIRDTNDLTDSEREKYLEDPSIQKYNVKKFLNDVHGIKGFFFVRQKRIPTILAQGVVVGLTKKGFG